jgi:hypothetical protein
LLIGLDLALPRGGGIAFVGGDFEGLQRAIEPPREGENGA